MSDATSSKVSPVTSAVVAAVVSSIATATVTSPNLLKQMTGAYNDTPAIVTPAPVVTLRQELITHRDYSGEHGLLNDAGVHP